MLAAQKSNPPLPSIPLFVGQRAPARTEKTSATGGKNDNRSDSDDEVIAKPVYSPHDGAPPEVQLHAIPIDIEHTGPANVTEYFTSRLITVEESKVHALADIAKQSTSSSAGTATVKKGSIRGRIFLGRDVKLPDGYGGLVLSRDVESNPGERACVVGSFTRFTHWKREIAPSKDDAVNRWMLLPRLSEAIHGPVLGKRPREPTADDSAQDAKRQKSAE